MKSVPLRQVPAIHYNCPRCDEPLLRLTNDAFHEYTKNYMEDRQRGNQRNEVCDGCNLHFYFNFEDDTIEILGDSETATTERSLALLRLDTSTGKPIHILVKSWLHFGQDGKSTGDRAYYFNEHTCPTNYLDSIFQIFEGGEADPHGIFKLVREVPLSAVLARCSESWEELQSSNSHHHEIFALFPELYAKD